jgi:hypothetical protein
MSFQNNSQIVTNSLVFYIDAANINSLNGSGSTTITDLGPTGYTGTFNGSVSYSGSNFGAIYFGTGATNYVNFGSNLKALDLVDKTFQAWINIPSYANMIILDKEWDNSPNNTGGWGFWMQGNGKLWFWNTPNKDLLDSGSTVVALNTWTNIAITYTAASLAASFYINGVLNSTISNNGIVEQTSSAQTLSLGLGRVNPLGGSGNIAPFNGLIATCSAYNRALSLSEIQQNYNVLKNRFTTTTTTSNVNDGFGGTVVTNNLMLYLDAANPSSYQAGSTIWYDLTGNFYNATLTSTGSNLPYYSNINNGALTFDGATNSVIQPVFLTNTTNFTLDVWIYCTATTAGNQCIFYNGNTSANGYGLFIFNNVYGALYGGIASFNGNNVSLNKWTHLALSYTSTGTLYINGISINNNNGSIITPSGNIALAKDPQSSGEFFNGYIANAKVYNRGLSASEILQNYNATKKRFNIS